MKAQIKLCNVFPYVIVCILSCGEKWWKHQCSETCLNNLLWLALGFRINRCLVYISRDKTEQEPSSPIQLKCGLVPWKFSDNTRAGYLYFEYFMSKVRRVFVGLLKLLFWETQLATTIEMLIFVCPSIGKISKDFLSWDFN